MKHLCDCGKLAVWLYMPASDNFENPFLCDECVNRGCSCQYVHCEDELPQGIKDKDWKWIDEDKIWAPLDEKGREYPCCEYDYDENGFDIEND